MELQNGTLDMAIVTNVEKVPGYTYLPIEVSRLVLVTAQDSDILKEARIQEEFPFPVISIQRLEGVPMVTMPVTTNSGNLARELFKSRGVEANIVLEVSDIRSLLDAVENGLGAAVCMNVPLGKHKLHFIIAPMVHWPEVMMEYEETEKISFSADGFGKFGTLDTDEDWDCEARRYYFNIVGKYGMQVQLVLKKASELDIKTICPLHGPILRENLEHYIGKYDIWSKYETESEGVYIACASIHGNTLKVCQKLKEILEKKGAAKVVLADLSREDWAEAVEDSFRYGKIVFASATYDMGIFTPMRDLLLNLKEKNYQNKKVAIIENGTWAPNAARCMKEIISTMKNVEIVEPIVTIKSTLKQENIEKLNELAENLLK